MNQSLLYQGPNFDLNMSAAKEGDLIRMRTYERQPDDSYKISDISLRKSCHGWKSENVAGARVSFVLKQEVEMFQRL